MNEEYFDVRNKFLNWLEETLPLDTTPQERSTIWNDWTRELVATTIDSIYSKSDSLDTLASDIANAIPDLQINDVYNHFLHELEIQPENLESEVINCLKSLPQLHEQDGIFTYEIYADYDDKLSVEEIEQICKSNEPELRLLETLDERYSYDNPMPDILNYVMDNLPNDWRVFTQDVQDILDDCIAIEYPIDHFLKQESKVDIIVDVGDANSNWGDNFIYPAWDSDPNVEIPKESGIRWLAETQGYDEPTLRAELSKGDIGNPQGFLESMRQELANFTADCPSLVFLASMPLSELIKLSERINEQRVDESLRVNPLNREDVGSIHIDKETQVGLYDKFNGGGSCLEVELEKDVNLPIADIYSALPDECLEYPIISVYCIPTSCWGEDNIKIQDSAAREQVTERD